MPLKTQFETEPTLNLTPMIDIVFLLIIFFMVGAKYSELDRQVELQVPEVAGAESLPAETAPVVVSVQDGGLIALGDQTVADVSELTGILSKLSAKNPELSVQVRADGRIDWQAVAEVLAACRMAGVASVDVPVRPATAGRAMPPLR